MTNTVKQAAWSAAAILTAPAYLTYRIAAALFGANRIFEGWSEAFSLLPGRWGAYLRTAFYRWVFPSCGSGAYIRIGVVFSHPTAALGRNVYIAPYACLGDVTVGDDALIGAHVSIVNGAEQHGMDRLDLPIREQPGRLPRITIGRDTLIGERSVVLADVGSHCVVGAGSVVTAPIPDYAVAAGVPAKVLRFRYEERTDTEER